jgi:hypothetical protein
MVIWSSRQPPLLAGEMRREQGHHDGAGALSYARRALLLNPSAAAEPVPVRACAIKCLLFSQAHQPHTSCKAQLERMCLPC